MQIDNRAFRTTLSNRYVNQMKKSPNQTQQRSNKKAVELQGKRMIDKIEKIQTGGESVHMSGSPSLLTSIEDITDANNVLQGSALPP